MNITKRLFVCDAGSVKGIIISFVHFMNRETSTRHGLQNYEGIGARFVKGKFQKCSGAAQNGTRLHERLNRRRRKFLEFQTLQDGGFHIEFALWHERNEPQIPKIFLGPTGPRFLSYTPAASHPEPLYTPDTAKATLYTPEPRPTPPPPPPYYLPPILG